MLIGIRRGFVSGQGSGWAADCYDQFRRQGWALRALNEYAPNTIQMDNRIQLSAKMGISLHLLLPQLFNAQRWIKNSIPNVRKWNKMNLKKKRRKRGNDFFLKSGSGKQQAVLELSHRKRQGFNCQDLWRIQNDKHGPRRQTSLPQRCFILSTVCLLERMIHKNAGRARSFRAQSRKQCSGGNERTEVQKETALNVSAPTT